MIGCSKKNEKIIRDSQNIILTKWKKNRDYPELAFEQLGPGSDLNSGEMLRV